MHIGKVQAGKPAVVGTVVQPDLACCLAVVECHVQLFGLCAIGIGVNAGVQLGDLPAPCVECVDVQTQCELALADELSPCLYPAFGQACVVAVLKIGCEIESGAVELGVDVGLAFLFLGVECELGRLGVECA